MSLPEASLNPQERQCLLGVARASIEHGLERGEPLPVRASVYAERLQRLCATFVTLRAEGHLRGCIGSPQVCRPLVEDVAHNAWAAAFQDPRFAPLKTPELASLQVHISALGPHEELFFRDEADLLARVRPGVDGLLLEAEGRRATLLPAVWESLHSPAEFLRHLKIKAGLDPEYWSPAVRVFRYEAENID